MKKLLMAAFLFSAMSAPAMAGWHGYWFTGSNGKSYAYDISNLGGAAVYAPDENYVSFTTGDITHCHTQSNVIKKVDDRSIAFSRFIAGKLCVFKPQSKSDEDFIVNQFKSKQMVTWNSYNIPTKGFESILNK
ncbi:hypothetical protein L4C34_13015 [Vibrio profundum]|uniref:hypothetical protein n=1 Tax=Vibrio profundum TaxID=2910247 RepID=UPI003D0F88CB